MWRVFAVVQWGQDWAEFQAEATFALEVRAIIMVLIPVPDPVIIIHAVTPVGLNVGRKSKTQTSGQMCRETASFRPICYPANFFQITSTAEFKHVLTHRLENSLLL